MLAVCQSGSAPKNAHTASAGTPAGESCKVIRDDTAGSGKNIIYRCCNGQAAINAAIADGVLESGIPVSFGGGAYRLQTAGIWLHGKQQTALANPTPRPANTP